MGDVCQAHPGRAFSGNAEDTFLQKHLGGGDGRRVRSQRDPAPPGALTAPERRWSFGALALTHLHGIQRQVARDLKLLPQNLLPDMVDAHELGHSSSQDTLTIGGVAQSGEGPDAGGWRLRTTQGPQTAALPLIFPHGSRPRRLRALNLQLRMSSARSLRQQHAHVGGGDCSLHGTTSAQKGCLAHQGVSLLKSE